MRRGARAVLPSLALCAAGCSLIYGSDLDDARGGTGATVSTPDAGDADVVNVPASEAGADATIAADTGTDAGSAYAAIVRADTPAAYWRLEEASGDTFHDELGGAPLKTVGPIDLTYAVPGIGGGSALRFERASAWLEVENTMDVDADFTIEAWARPTYKDDFYSSVWERNSQSNGNRDGMFYWINPKRSDVGSAFEVWKTGTNIDGAHGAFLSATSLSHVVVVRSGKVCTAWVNGIQTDKTQDVAIPDSTNKLQWGVGLTGDLDELAVYAHALSSARINAHFAAR